MSEKFGITFFTDTFPPTHDGVANVTGGLCRVLSTRGHRINVLTVRSKGQPRTERTPEGVTIWRVPSLPAPRYPEYRVALFPPWGLKIPLGDVVHIQTPGLVGLRGLLAARGKKVPSVGTYHTDLVGILKGVGAHFWSRKFYDAWGRFSRDLCLACTVATAPTASALATLKEGVPLGSDSHLEVVENGVDLQRFHPGDGSGRDQPRLVQTQRPLVTYLGRLTRDKGVWYFLDAVETLGPNIPFLAVVGGVGPEGPRVRQRMAASPRLRDRTLFLGSVPEEAKPSLLAQSRVFVLPSRFDTSSMAVLEAMACGVPCVLSNRGGPGDIGRRSGAGLLVEPEDPVAVGNAILRLLQEPGLARESARRGMDWVRSNASLERTAKAYEAVYRAAMDAFG